MDNISNIRCHNQKKQFINKKINIENIIKKKTKNEKNLGHPLFPTLTKKKKKIFHTWIVIISFKKTKN